MRAWARRRYEEAAWPYGGISRGSGGGGGERACGITRGRVSAGVCALQRRASCVVLVRSGRRVSGVDGTKGGSRVRSYGDGSVPADPAIMARSPWMFRAYPGSKRRGSLSDDPRDEHARRARAAAVEAGRSKIDGILHQGKVFLWGRMESGSLVVC